MKLQKPSDKFITKVLKSYSRDGGNELSKKLSRLFKEFNNDKNKFDVLIKVAALNKIYSTAITNITPVAARITKIALGYSRTKSTYDYVKMVDKISNVKWVNDNNEVFERNNLSFASKYVHFLSTFKTPIYDSYIWILIKGYLFQYKGEKISFASPKNFKEFYLTFERFKKKFELERYSNYELDKFLWHYGRATIKKIAKQESLNDLNTAKSFLKACIREC